MTATIDWNLTSSLCLIFLCSYILDKIDLNFLSDFCTNLVGESNAEENLWKNLKFLQAALLIYQEMVL